MKQEIDLLSNYPRPKRDVTKRGEVKTAEDQRIAREFGQAFFDGDRRVGYGGFSYNPRFWEPVVPTFQEHWGLAAGDSVLDVGCAKGFMIFDLQRLIPGLTVSGLDISEYAITNAKDEVKDLCRVGDAVSLPFEDNSFDVVISITTVHNLERPELIRALQEIERVSRRGSFVTVDAFRDEAEKERMSNWNLTAKTVLHVDDWRVLFDEAGYTGDYYWFIP